MSITPNTTATEVSTDIATILEEAGIGKKGVTLFTTVDPDPVEATTYLVVADDPNDTELSMLLSGSISMQREGFSIQASSKDRTTGRSMLERAFRCIHNKQDFTVRDGTKYEVVLAMSPIRLLGVDRDRRFTHEAAFIAVRKEQR